MMPDVTFEYDAEHEICFGKAFDNRAGCACIVDTMKQLEKEQASLAVNVVGAFAAQEEVGTCGAVVTRHGSHLDGRQKRWECPCLASAREFSF